MQIQYNYVTLYTNTMLRNAFPILMHIILFTFSSNGEFVVLCSCSHFVFLQAAAKSCSMYFLCPGIRMKFICGDT